MAWTDESKEQAVQMYKDAEPTADTSVEIVQQIADELGEVPNGVRMILTKAGVYIKKTPAKSEAKASTRVSKEDAQAALTQAIQDAGQEANDDIISKLTGKAAVYLTAVVHALND